MNEIWRLKCERNGSLELKYWTTHCESFFFQSRQRNAIEHNGSNQIRSDFGNPNQKLDFSLILNAFNLNAIKTSQTKSTKRCTAFRFYLIINPNLLPFNHDVSASVDVAPHPNFNSWVTKFIIIIIIVVNYNNLSLEYRLF